MSQPLANLAIAAGLGGVVWSAWVIQFANRPRRNIHRLLFARVVLTMFGAVVGLAALTIIFIAIPYA